MDADSYRKTDLSPEETAEHDRVFGALTQATRDLMDAQLRTELGHDEAEEITAAVESLTRRLLKQAAPGPLGVQIGEGGRIRNHGNAVVGLRNPVAPPLQVRRSREGRAWASFHLNGLYEGPPGLVHGGVSAMVLDQLLGEAAAAGRAPGMTGSLTLRYSRPTPLGDLAGEAWIECVDGIKTTVRGHITDPDGNPTVEAEGLFILPRWARDAMDRAGRKPPRFE